MGKRDRILPPGPNPREDMPKEKDNRQLREHLRQRRAGEEGGGDVDAPSQAEEEVRRREEKDRR